MGMRKKIAKGVGYAMAPRATFTALHPRKAAFAAAATWLLGRVRPSRRRTARRRSMATGLGAAAVTVPVGLWLGNRIRNAAREDHAGHNVH